MRDLFSPAGIVDSGMCIGCGNCNVKMHFDKYGQYKPNPGAEGYFTPSLFFSSVCPFSPASENEDQIAEYIFTSVTNKHSSIGRYISCHAGYADEGCFRMQGSSGGLVSWVASELLRRKLVDGIAHVVPVREPCESGKFFEYRISRSSEELRNGAKSRYYPVELSGIISQVYETPGRYAVVAVPCMIKAIQLRRTVDPLFRERISFTLGLFCGHMKSAFFTESFAWQMKVPIDRLGYIDFRNKLPDRPANWYNTLLRKDDGSVVNRDWWRINDGDWGAGFFMNDACNWCDDVVAETADISFGDAWVEPYSSDGKGTNVIVIRSFEIAGIISEGIKSQRLKLDPVTPGFVEQTQSAGLRQRRQGLAYRLTWSKKGIQPVKRVSPDNNIPEERKKIYLTRYRISKWSHHIFLLAKRTGCRRLYLFWARCANSVYYGLAYYNGSYRNMWKRFKGLGRTA